MIMFEKFGEFSSFEEINMAAEGFKNEGDLESIKALAKENGIDDMDAEDYIAGDTDKLCTATTAALGRLKVEKENSKADHNITRVLFMIAELMATNGKDAGIFLTKGKCLDGIINELRSEASENKTGNVGCVCGTDLELMQRIRKYYGRQ